MIKVEFVGAEEAWTRAGGARPTVAALYSFRYDAALVPALRENLAGVADAFISYDDRGATEPFSGEPVRRAALLATAREIGADWVLAVAPDERFETGLSSRIRELTRDVRPIAWTFALRELYAPGAYRVDGIWGHQRVARLFPTPPEGLEDREALHGRWYDPAFGLELRPARLNLYHLKMLTPERREGRRRLYAALDPGRIHRSIGYDYLSDEMGLQLERIPPGRGYLPKHEEDAGLWMAPVPSARPLADPPRALAGRMRCSARVGDWRRATDIAAELLRRSDSDKVSRMAAERLLAPLPNEAWRRWCVGSARRRDGAEVAKSDLAVVVIGFKAQEDLAAAVASLRAQQAAEIVVVNSGGGPAREKLGPHLEHVRLIEVEAPLLVGAARNIGIDASRAPYVAFLAGDCTAAPGWVEARLEAHHAGARAVASAVAPPERAGYWTRVSHLFLFGTRSPLLPSAMAQRYGASYDRRVFAEAGYFNPALRIGEDSDLAGRLADHLGAEWNRWVVTVHGGPTGPWAFIRDMHARGRRAAGHQPHRRAGKPLAAFRRYVSDRIELALRVARDGWRLPAAEVERLRPAIRLGALAYVSGVWRGYLALDRATTELRRSHAAIARGKLDAAIGHAARAAARNAEDIPTLLRLVDLLRRNPAQAARLGDTLRRVEWLSAFDPKRQLALCDWLLERDMFAEAEAFAALARLGTPCDAALHVRLADAAAERGDLVAFERAAHDALAIDPSLRLDDRLSQTAGLEPAR